MQQTSQPGHSTVGDVMTGNATSRILATGEADEKFAVIVRLQEKPERGAGWLKSESGNGSGFGKSDWPGHPHLREQSAKLLILPL